MSSIRPSGALRWWMQLAYLALLLPLVWQSGCSFDPSGYRFSEFTYECETRILQCRLKSVEANFQVLASGVAWARLLGPKVGDQVYCWVALPFGRIQEISFEPFKRSTMLSVSHLGQSTDQAELLRVRMGRTAKHYVAYDARPTQKPPWLKNEFVRRLDHNKAPYFIKIATPEGPVDLEIWEKKNNKGVLGAGEEIGLPGNLYQYPAQAFPRERVAMYVTFFLPEISPVDWNCWNPPAPEQRPHVFITCASSPEEAASIAQTQCAGLLKSNPFTPENWRCGETTAKKTDDGCVGSGRWPMSSYLASSVVAFNSASSTVQFTFPGQAPIVRGVDGLLHFEYLLDPLQCDCMRTMRVQSMRLQIPPITVPDAGAFTHVSFALVGTTDAFCDDLQKVGKKPCDSYRIVAGNFDSALSAFCTEENSWQLFQGNNSQDVVIQVDHAQKRCHVWGQFTTTVQIGDSPHAVTCDYDLSGEFLNFIPQASAIESQDGAPCREGANSEPIWLIATASYDIYPSLSSMVSFDWYQDYGLPSERKWGSGLYFEIPPYSLPAGAHQFTLVVNDPLGAAATDDFTVTVYDLTAPFFTSVPPDAIALSLDGNPVCVSIGQAQASDGCALGELFMSHDAPADLLFPPGVTTVTWTAMDPSGNKAQATQKVFVFDPDEVEVLAPQWWVRREAVVDGAALVPYLSILPWPEGGTSLIWWAWCLMADELPGPASLFGLSDGAIVGTRSGGSNLAMGGALASLGSGGLVGQLPPLGGANARVLRLEQGWVQRLDGVTGELLGSQALSGAYAGLATIALPASTGGTLGGHEWFVAGLRAADRNTVDLWRWSEGLEEEVQWTGPLVPGYAYEGLAATVRPQAQWLPGDDLDSFLAREVEWWGLVRDLPPAIEAIVGSEATLLVAYNAGLGTVRHWMLAPADRGGYYPRDLELVVGDETVQVLVGGANAPGIDATGGVVAAYPPLPRLGAVNHPPSWARVLPELVLVPEGQWVDLGFEAVDTDPGQSLSLQWTALGLPAESSLNPATGQLLFWAGPEVPDRSRVAVTVRDNGAPPATTMHEVLFEIVRAPRIVDLRGRLGPRLLELTLDPGGYLPPPDGGRIEVAVEWSTDMVSWQPLDSYHLERSPAGELEWTGVSPQVEPPSPQTGQIVYLRAAIAPSP